MFERGKSRAPRHCYDRRFQHFKAARRRLPVRAVHLQEKPIRLWLPSNLRRFLRVRGSIVDFQPFERRRLRRIEPEFPGLLQFSSYSRSSVRYQFDKHQIVILWSLPSLKTAPSMPCNMGDQKISHCAQEASDHKQHNPDRRTVAGDVRLVQAQATSIMFLLFIGTAIIGGIVAMFFLRAKRKRPAHPDQASPGPHSRASSRSPHRKDR